MGKRARKTRWRALDVADDHSDSEESNTNSSAISGRYPRSYQSQYYSKFPYSSQSTPRRRYQYDGSTKSTRSSSTTSENKITFNEDEYTRITTPRQDVLFKKGYLNKPKSYQTQTSTGNSTISTGTSTENGTPDHQSTDLDYESQFMFPNGFVDQNGIYYVNSYEPYPLMLYNPPTYYHECSNTKSKRHSTGSLSESMSPNNEEATSQDLSQSGGEASNSVSDYGGQPVYNMVFPGYYVNGACTPADLVNGHIDYEPVKKLKKRRERNSSKTILGDSSECTDENSSDENIENSPQHRVTPPSSSSNHNAQTKVEHFFSRLEAPEAQTASDESIKTVPKNSSDTPIINGCAEPKTEQTEEKSNPDQTQSALNSPKLSKYNPDAEEFIPRAYQTPDPLPHIKMFPPNFVPIPLVPINDFGGPNFSPHPAFIPPGIPINFISHHPGQKVFPPSPGFINFAPPMIHEAKVEEIVEQNEEKPVEEGSNTATPSHTPANVEESKSMAQNKSIDIATVVSKLEEAVKQQEKQHENLIKEQQKEVIVKEELSKAIINETKPFRGSPRFNRPSGFKRNHYNKYRSSPVRSGETSQPIQNGEATSSQPLHVTSAPYNTEKSLPNALSNSAKPLLTHEAQTTVADDPKQIRNSPERFRKGWKPNGYQHGYQNGLGSPRRQLNYQQTQNCQEPALNGSEKYILGPQMSKSLNESFNKSQPVLSTASEQNRRHITVKKLAKTLDISDEASKLEATPSKSNQWISVSSRKKKKNKNFDEAECIEQFVEAIQDGDNSTDAFESYDVSLLVDVVPLSKVEELNQEVKEKKIEDMLISIAQNKSHGSLMNELPTIKIPEVSDIEKDLIVKIEEKNMALTVTQAQNDTENEEPPLKETPAVTETVQNDKEETFKLKKKSKKGTQKPLTKKVIITDIDLSQTIKEIKPEVKKVVKKLEEPKPKTEPESIIAEVVKETEVVTETTEKKLKKKKKSKLTKPALNDALSGSNTMLSTVEDSYDFLLEHSLINESTEKTNDEVSLELDKLIQKGMYSSLQEKIKILNVEPENDAFFKTMNAMPTNKDKPTANGFLKTPDFNRIFQSSRQFLKPNLVSVEGQKDTDSKVGVVNSNIKQASLDPDAADSGAGLFLENLEVNQLLQEPTKPVEPIKEETEQQKKKQPGEMEQEEEKDQQEEKEQQENIGKLYPITQAVKEWMSKTREATPEIELLKSPLTIQKEFGDSDSPLDDLDDTLGDENEEEITLFSTDEAASQEQPDLLEFWENEISPSEYVKKVSDQDLDNKNNAKNVCSDTKGCVKCKNGSIKEGEEEIKIYESKYGQNEPYLNLQRELKSKQNNNPRPGNLPYRAICCSLQ